MSRSAQNRSENHRLGLILVSISVIAWSTAGLFTSVITADTSTILFWRSLFGALVTFIVIALMPSTGGLNALVKFNRIGFTYSLITSLSMLLFISALRNTSVAHVAVITAAVPLFAAWGGWVFLKESAGRSAIIASFAAFIGVTIMVGTSSDGAIFGDSLGLAMAIAMAAMIIISRRFPGIPALPATCFASLITAFVTMPLANLTTVSVIDVSLLVLFGFINQLLGFGLFALGSRHLMPTQTALLTALEAPLAPLWVWLILGHTPHSATLFGGAIVIIAVLTHLRINMQ